MKIVIWMRNGDIMYIDETIVLDKNLPTELLGDFEELGKYYEAGDWLNFDLLFEVVEAEVWNCINFLLFDRLLEKTK